MPLGAGQLASVLGAMHPEIDEASLDARLKYFQRRDFPSDRVAVGKGLRAEYGAEDLMMAVWAFELLAGYVPPAQVMELVRDRWEAIEWTLREAWSDRDREFASPVLVRGVGVGPKGVGGGSLAAITQDDLRRWMQGRGDFRSALLLDARRIARDFDRALEATIPKVGTADGRPPEVRAAEARIADVRASLDRWAGSRPASE